MESASMKLTLLMAILWTTSTKAQDVTSMFRQALIDLANDGLGVQAYQDYINTAAELTYNTTNVPGDQLVSQIASTLATRMRSQSTLLSNTRKSIEDSLQGSTPGTLPNCCNVTSNRKAYDSRFRNETDTNSMCTLGLSTSPVPTLSTSVLNVMQVNLQRFPSLRWQYFGTEDGNMYRYPTTVGQTCDKTVFDPRLSVWYKSTISPNAKDVVILIQRSNSMRSVLSQAIQVAQLLVDNLNSKDQVAVVAFSDQTTASTSDSCYSTQLSVFNNKTKLELDSFLNNLDVANSANFTLAFQKAFDLFMSSNSTAVGLNQRERAIVLITNGVGLDSQQQNTLNVIKEGNRQLQNKVIIFAYMVDGSSSTLAVMANITRQVANDHAFGETVPTEPQQLSTTMQDSSHLRTAMKNFFTAFAITDVNAPIVYTVPYSDSTVGLIMSLCVPVIQRGSLFGVTCVDVTMDTLFSEVQYFQQTSSSYAFLMDGYGRLLIHPLLPQLSTLSVDTPLAELTDIEYDTDGNMLAVRNGMLSRIPGNLTFVSRTVKPRGDKTLKGVSSEMNRHTYYWNPVADTNFSLCVVIADNYQNSSVIWQSTISSYPPVYLMDYKPLNDTTPGRCNFFGRIVLRNKTMVKLAPQAFLYPSVFLDNINNYDETTYTSWSSYLTGQIGTSPDIKTNIRDAVASTYKLEEIWQERDTSAFAAWRYFGRKEGVYRKMPGSRMAANFDPTLRPWYQQAVAENNGYAIYGPYLDASGTGCYLTLAKAIQRNITTPDDSSRIVGVMGLDFNVSYFNAMMLNVFTNCSQPNQCFIIDKSGYVLLYSTFLQSSFDCKTLQHITCLEKTVAQDMIAKGLLIDDVCTNYADTTQLMFWKVKLADNPTLSDKYDIYGIDGTNIFVIIKHVYTNDALCVCHSDSFDCSSSSLAPCQSPCYSSSTYSQVCRGRSSYNSSTPPCYPPPPSLTLTNLAAQEAPYISAYCPCQGPVNCSISTTTTTSTSTTVSTVFTAGVSTSTSTGTFTANVTFIPESSISTTPTNPPGLPSSGIRSTTVETSPGSSSSSNLLPLLALLVLLVVPVIFISLWCRKKRLQVPREENDYKFTESSAYRYFNQFMHRQKGEETDHYMEIDAVNVHPQLSYSGSSVVDSGIYFDFKCNPKVDELDSIDNDDLMTENPAYGKSVKMANNNGTAQGDSGHVIQGLNNVGNGRPIYLQLTKSQSSSSHDTQQKDESEFFSSRPTAEDNSMLFDQKMTENSAYGKSPKILENSRLSSDVDQQNKLPIGTNSDDGTISPSIPSSPDHGVYLNASNSANASEAVVSAPIQTGLPGVFRTPQTPAQPQGTGNIFHGQPKLTTLENRMWIANNVDPDALDDEDDESMTDHENDIYIHTNWIDGAEKDGESNDQTDVDNNATVAAVEYHQGTNSDTAQ